MVLGFVLTLAFSALAWGRIATSPLGLNPLAGLGACPLGTAIQVLIPTPNAHASLLALQRRGFFLTHLRYTNRSSDRRLETVFLTCSSQPVRISG